MRFTTSEKLRKAVEAQSTLKWRRQVLNALPDFRAGVRSVLELEEAKIRRAHNLPAGRRQITRRSDGTEYLDLVVEEFMVHNELDGRLGHDKTREVWRDHRRDNRSELAGYRHFRYGWADLFDRPCEYAAEQAAVLRQQGWTGQFRRCPRCPREA
jgi:hypothetical protein